MYFSISSLKLAITRVQCLIMSSIQRVRFVYLILGVALLITVIFPKSDEEMKGCICWLDDDKASIRQTSRRRDRESRRNWRANIPFDQLFSFTTCDKVCVAIKARIDSISGITVIHTFYIHIYREEWAISIYYIYIYILITYVTAERTTTRKLDEWLLTVTQWQKRLPTSWDTLLYDIALADIDSRLYSSYSICIFYIILLSLT